MKPGDDFWPVQDDYVPKEWSSNNYTPNRKREEKGGHTLEVYQ